MWPLLHSDLLPAAIDRKLGACREGSLEREEKDGLGHFLRRSEAIHGNNPDRVPLDVRPHHFRRKHLFEDARFDGANSRNRQAR